MRRALLAVCLAGALAEPARAQLARTLAGGLGAGSVRSVVSDAAGTTGTLTGVAVGGGGSLHLGPVYLGGTYLQGRLLPDTGSSAARDLVEAGLTLAARPVTWLSLGGGLLVRGYIMPSGTERWILGVLRARAEGAILTPVIRTHVELWRAVSAEVNIGTGSGSAQGGEAGLTLRLPQTPFWGRLTYAIDRATIADGSRAETLERVAIAVGYGGP